MKTINLIITSLLTVTASQAAVAFEKGDFLIRGGFATVSPSESSTNINVGGTDLGVDLAVDNNTQLGLTFAYFVTDRINIEVLAATPFTHAVNFGTSNALGTGDKLGEVTHLPPTVSLNYYFNDPSSKFQPYVGAGLNYTFFFEEEFTGENKAIGLQDLSLSESFGLAFQVGADYMIDEKWFVNAAVRWIDIDTEVSFKLNSTAGHVDELSIDPWVYTVSVGYKF
jgi:outer membrane protein